MLVHSKRLILVPLLVLLAQGLLFAAAKPDTVYIDTLEGVDLDPSSEWVMSRRQVFDRSEAGKVIEKLEYKIADIWVEKYRTIRFKDSEGRDTLEVAMELDLSLSTWDTTSTVRTQYPAHGTIEKQKETSTELVETKDVYTFNANDSVTEIVHLMKNGASIYSQTGKTTYDRSVEDTVKVSYYAVMDGDFVIKSERLIAFNAQGQPVYDSSAADMGGDLGTISVTTSTYNAMGNVEQTIARVDPLNTSFRSTFIYGPAAAIRHGATRLPYVAAQVKSATAYTLSGKRIATVSLTSAGSFGTLPTGSYVIRYTAADGATFRRHLTVR
jgi:hypothetical protein